jgi:hypothetical protein
MVGTPGYMAPEQVRGDSIDVRCDLYALGATLYEMLTGRTPHTGDTVHGVAMATLFGTIPPLRALRADCPENLAQIVMRALGREPSDRFASAREMKRALDHWQADQAPRTSLEPAPGREDVEDTLRIRVPNAARRPPRGKTRLRALAAVTCLAAVGAFALSQGLLVQSPNTAVTGRVTALALQASELAPFELAVHQASAVTSALVARSSAAAAGLLAEARTSALVARSSASAAELLSHVRTSAQELLQSARRSAPAWVGVVGGSADE